ncbi:hypothetical protein CFP65_6963 [Kitasatospora sp. MMS16-BH015]|uniref:S1 family serine peptidase n=1 Tax=Kitasatospora sp. MMS16-BH015 TaxID=2018025 RepID=UPI000CA253C7|nr:serine protease [Kitasatospora sp. MMS16-BH015]AUG81575.1 hypothetical protein CFP65_6963 [Kitasatospora sp. MMS16-BH015]
MRHEAAVVPIRLSRAGLRLWVPLLISAALAPAALAGGPAAALQGAADADITQYPDQVSIRYRGSHVCGGSLIDPRHVLAPASCLDVMAATALTVRTGSGLLDAARTSEGDGEPGVEERISRAEIHPGYDPATRVGDLAVLTLAAPVPFGPTRQAADLPEQGSDPAPGTTAMVAGWGATAPWSAARSPVLRAAAVRIVERSACQSTGATDLGTEWLCASAPGESACRGDDGDPLTVGGTLIGLATLPPAAPGTEEPTAGRCRTDSSPDVYVNIGAYSDWIRSAAGQ